MTNKSDRSVNALRQSRLTGLFLLWFVLTGIAAATLTGGGVAPYITGPALVLSLFPAILTLFVALAGRAWPSSVQAALVCLPWLLMSSVFVMLTGGISSPALVFAVFPPLFALAFGWRMLAIEAAVFSLMSALLAISLSAFSADFPAASDLARTGEAFAIAGLCLLPFLIAGFRQHRADPPKAATSPEPLTKTDLPVETAAPANSAAEGLEPLETVPDAHEERRAIVDLTREGHVRSVSGDLPDGLSLKPGMGFTDAFPEETRAPLLLHMTNGGTFRHPVKGGGAVELTVDRHDLGARVFILDVADIEAGLAETGKASSTIAAEAEAALAERTAFFASLSHELKTPLNAILGFTEIMRMELRGEMPDAYKDYASLIHESGQDLLLMVEDILDYARTEAGEVQLDCEPVDLVASARSVMEQLSGQAHRTGVRVSLQATGEVWALADVRAVRQIWQNLLSNALKYSEEGGVVTLDARAGKEVVGLSVRDHGAGMDAEDLDRIARPFQQGRNAKGRTGTGLGLAVVKSFADAMQGKVIIDTAPGRGTRVRVMLPKIDAEQYAPMEDAAE
ncbi:HAMP domain-containing sensor histidine kinase [Henriciella sp.]|uniref:sensor histidine kinase n=1 Tax=Henriciella sp. TaxID=1968823 RepID=UPI0026315E20|nr:HAMP domain-containing sensor histidine kinase [Henriciella sp.]